ncbi:MAG TPA: 4-(cytidine 5'-diphospho)-2-C-methyl-D-erythritol kinase [Hanamia sp.]|nr:4-(cytidine 5'-diphospho)-2-C-methyl-D-erythritol kinase [Hanamia sp.]
MVIFPNCKINLGLNIIRKRDDGFHDLETVFYPLPIHDVLEIITDDESTNHFFNTGIFTGEHEDNLCLKAYHLIKNDFPELPAIKMQLHKVIPMGAGLGGGSADAVFTLLLLNQKYNLYISQQKLFEYALSLGSDCPFFLINKPSLAYGRGEVSTPIPLSLAGYKMLIVNPGIHINTKDIFSKIIPAIPSKKISVIIGQPVETWKDELKNDFEKIVFQKHPEISDIKNQMYRNGAIYASMTGTGSTIFGIFKMEEEVRYAAKKSYFYQWLSQL